MKAWPIHRSDKSMMSGWQTRKTRSSMLSIHKPVFLFDLLGGQCMKGKALPSSSRLQPLVSGLIGSSMRMLLAFLTRGSKMSLLNDMLAKRH